MKSFPVHPSTTFGVGAEFSINSLAATIEATILDRPLSGLQRMQRKLQLLAWRWVCKRMYSNHYTFRYPHTIGTKL